MTTTSMPKPRERRPPSERDQQIYLAWQTGRTQVELAHDYGISQSRISQLIRRVRAWRNESPLPSGEGGSRSEPGEGLAPTSHSGPGSALAPHDPEAPASSAGQYVEDRLHREQLEFITRESLRSWRRKHETVTQKRGTRGDKPIDETTTRTSPPNLQCLRVALQAIRHLSSRRIPCAVTQARSASEGLTTDDATTARAPFADRQDQLVDLLTDLLNDAVAEGKVRSTGVCEDERAFATDLIAFLLGQHHRGFGVAVVAADGEHGRPCTGPNLYPGHDPLRLDDPPTQARTASEGPGVETFVNAEACHEVTCNSASNHQPLPQPPATTTTSAPAATSPQASDAPQLPIQNPESKTEDDPDLARYISAGLSEVSARRLRHQEKLEELRRLQRTGLPFMMYFDPIEDGRPPPL